VLPFFSPRAPALRTGLGDNSALAVTLVTGSGVRETTEDALLGALYLSGAVTVGTPGGLGAWLGAGTLAQGTVLGAQYIELLFTAEGGFLEGDGKPVVQVGTALGGLTGGGGCPTEEGIEDITKAAEVKALKTSAEDPGRTGVPEAVIGSPFIRVGEDFVGFVYLFEPLLSPFAVIMVGVVLEGELAKGSFYFLIGGISIYTEGFIIVLLCWHS
jgi:hypothetical protein